MVPTGDPVGYDRTRLRRRVPHERAWSDVSCDGRAPRGSPTTRLRRSRCRHS